MSVGGIKGNVSNLNPVVDAEHANRKEGPDPAVATVPTATVVTPPPAVATDTLSRTSSGLSTALQAPLIATTPPPQTPESLRDNLATFSQLAATMGPRPQGVEIADHLSVHSDALAQMVTGNAATALPPELVASVLRDSALEGLEAPAAGLAAVRFDAVASSLTEVGQAVVQNRAGPMTAGAQAMTVQLSAALAPAISRALSEPLRKGKLDASPPGSFDVSTFLADPSVLATATAIRGVFGKQKKEKGAGDKQPQTPSAALSKPAAAATPLVATQATTPLIATQATTPLIATQVTTAASDAPTASPTHDDAVTLPGDAVRHFERLSENNLQQMMEMPGFDIMAYANLIISECSRGAQDDLKEVLTQMKKINAQKASMRTFISEAKEQRAKMNAEMHTEYDRLCQAGTIDAGTTSFEQYAARQTITLYSGSLEPDADGMPYPDPLAFQMSPDRPTFARPLPPPPPPATAQPTVSTPTASTVQPQPASQSAPRSSREGTPPLGPPSWLDTPPSPSPKLDDAPLSVKDTKILGEMKRKLNGWTATERPPTGNDKQLMKQTDVDYDVYWGLELRRRRDTPAPGITPAANTPATNNPATPHVVNQPTPTVVTGPQPLNREQQTAAVNAMLNVAGSGSNYSSAELAARATIATAANLLDGGVKDRLDTVMKDYLSAVAVSALDHQDHSNFAGDNMDGRRTNDCDKMSTSYQMQRLLGAITGLPEDKKAAATNYIQLQIAEVARDCQRLGSDSNKDNNPGCATTVGRLERCSLPETTLPWSMVASVTRAQTT